MPKILYELIPRKCYIDIPGSDDNIKHVSDISIKVDSKRVITVPIYSIKDGNTVNKCNGCVVVGYILDSSHVNLTEYDMNNE